MFSCKNFNLVGPTLNGQKRARVGIYLGHSPHHATSVALILNLLSGCNSLQFHYVVDSNFETTRPQLGEAPLPKSLWQEKCYFKRSTNHVIGSEEAVPGTLSSEGASPQLCDFSQALDLRLGEASLPDSPGNPLQSKGQIPIKTRELYQVSHHQRDPLSTPSLQHPSGEQQPGIKSMDPSCFGQRQPLMRGIAVHAQRGQPLTRKRMSSCVSAQEHTGSLPVETSSKDLDLCSGSRA